MSAFYLATADQTNKEEGVTETDKDEVVGEASNAASMSSAPDASTDFIKGKRSAFSKDKKDKKQKAVSH